MGVVYNPYYEWVGVVYEEHLLFSAAEESLEDSAAVTDSESLNRQRQDLKKTLVELQLKLKHSFGDEKLAVLSEYDKLLQVWPSRSLPCSIVPF